MRKAAGGGCDEVVAWLDDSGHVDARWSEHKVSLIMIASSKGHERLFDLLQRRGANVNLQQKKGTTALMIACVNGHPRVVRRLLRAGARVELINSKGDTALDAVKAKLSADAKLGPEASQAQLAVAEGRAESARLLERASQGLEDEEVYLCPVCHVSLLDEVNDDPVLVCDGGCCSLFVRGETRWSCEDCDYDICTPCAFGRKKRNGRCSHPFKVSAPSGTSSPLKAPPLKKRSAAQTNTNPVGHQGGKRSR
uniref:Uncharacterized protein n=1 Tax=Haptolina ericina TaxID=156174 RepID=A0A7S3AMN0_9EUKA